MNGFSLQPRLCGCCFPQCPHEALWQICRSIGSCPCPAVAMLSVTSVLQVAPGRPALSHVSKDHCFCPRPGATLRWLEGGGA